MKTKLPGITITGTELSDLFFNHEKPNYDSVNRMRDGGNEELEKDEREALLKDATAFSEMTGKQIDPSELVEDFMERV